jgi:hypothetical protein
MADAEREQSQADVARKDEQQRGLGAEQAKTAARRGTQEAFKGK